MNPQFYCLFTPFKLRNVTLRNRIVSTGHLEAYAEKGRITDRYIRYHVEKAKGGVALTVFGGSSSVHPSSPAAAWSMICNHDDSIIPDYRRMADAVHAHGAAVMTQLTHMGRRGISDVEDWRPLLAPSGVPEPYHREVPHAMEASDIHEIVLAFGQAAMRCKRGGLDGVEIVAAWNQLIDQFWSPLSNRRTDSYGGSLENRLRFGMEVLKEVRRQVGDDFVVGLRMSGNEFVEGGLSPEELGEIARRMARTGMIDYLNIISGAGQDVKALYKGFPSMYDPEAPYVDLAVAIKAAVPAMPILHAGRVIDPLLAEELLSRGKVDLVGMTRALIADPQMPNKARLGRLQEIRRCVGINQDCIDRLYFGKPITCSINPVIGREHELAELVPAKNPKRVVVVGGGPAGLETARVAAARGHEVLLLEKNTFLGGQLALAAKAPRRENLAEFIQWQERELRRLGVTVRMGFEASLDTVLAEKADAVVVATGSKPHIPEIPGRCLDHVFTAHDVFLGRASIGSRVLILDDEAQQQGLSTAEFLLDQGKRVELVTRLFYAGLDIGITTLIPLYERVFAKGISVTPHSRVTAIEKGSVLVEHLYSRQTRRIEADTVVVATTGRADDALYHLLRGRVKELHMAGDCVSPRKLHHALLEGIRVARDL